MSSDIIEEIKFKREFSELRDIDIEKAFNLFSKKQISEEEKLDLTKEQLRKMFSVFTSKKLLNQNIKNKSEDWFLRKHLSTKERLPFYPLIYKRLLNEYSSCSIIDLGAGINGFSYPIFNKLNIKVSYTSIESFGQLVKLTNSYFYKNNFDAESLHLSLFEISKVKEIICSKKNPRVIFLFKVIDALESLEKDYSKILISDTIEHVDKFVLSFSTKSLGGKSQFKANRVWILNFIKENFEILDNFEINTERYISFKPKN